MTSDRKLRAALVLGSLLKPEPSPSLVTLTRGDGKIEVRRGSKGEELLRKAGWREAK